MHIGLVSTRDHTGLFFPDGPGRFVEYGYGDWSWYALGENDGWRIPSTLLWPNRSTLGRRHVIAPDAQALRGRSGGDDLVILTVSLARAERLRARLQAEFAAGGQPHYHSDHDMWFVRHPRRYCVLHNCHDHVVEWLEELGCRVAWAPIRIRLEVEPRSGSK